MKKSGASPRLFSPQAPGPDPQEPTKRERQTGAGSPLLQEDAQPPPWRSLGCCHHCGARRLGGKVVRWDRGSVPPSRRAARRSWRLQLLPASGDRWLRSGSSVSPRRRWAKRRSLWYGPGLGRGRGGRYSVQQKREAALPWRAATGGKGVSIRAPPPPPFRAARGFPG